MGVRSMRGALTVFVTTSMPYQNARREPAPCGRTVPGLKEKPFPAGVPIRSKAIHDYCVECSGSAKEASGCPNKKCPLWEFRKGRREKLTE